MPLVGSEPFDSEKFSGFWHHTYLARRYADGYEPRALVKSGLSINATCKKCGSGALINVASGEVQMKCSFCDQNEFVKRELLDHRPT